MTNTSNEMADRNRITTYTFASSSEAWGFMRACDKRGEFAGYPSLGAPYTVQVAERAE